MPTTKKKTQPRNEIRRELPPLHLNKQDHKAQKERDANEKRVEFTGKVGLARSQINYKVGTKFEKKPHLHTAAKVRARPFANYLNKDDAALAAAHHVHPRSKRTVKPRIKKQERERKSKHVKA